MKTLLPLVFFALAATGQSALAPADDVVRIVNRLRAPGGACGSKAPPLVPQGALDAAAARLAHGATLDAALKSADYRMTEVQVITVTGQGLHAQLEALLTKRYCAKINSPSLVDAGVHEQDDQLWIVLAAPFAPRVDLTRQQIAQRMLTLVNEARTVPRRCGDKPFASARPVRWNLTLEDAASRHAADMAENDYLSHGGRDGSTPAQRVTRSSYRYRITGENIAAGQLSPEEAVQGWLHSPTHCANLMNGLFTEMGVALSVSRASRMGVYWVQIFGTPN